MVESELTELVTIVGIVTAINTIIMGIITLVYRYFEKESDRDFEARQKAEVYYRPLYGHIAVLHEYVGGYLESLITDNDETAKVFVFKESKYRKLTSKEILNEFNKSYEEFSSFYIKKKSEGYELFVSKELGEMLEDLWSTADSFYEDNETMKNKKEIDGFRVLADKTTKIMEKLYGLN